MLSAGQSRWPCNVDTALGIEFPKEFASYEEAKECKNTLEKQIKRPYHTKSYFNFYGNRITKVIEGYVEGCEAPDKSGDERFAKECADSLTVLTGKNHVARFFNNLWKVVSEK